MAWKLQGADPFAQRLRRRFVEHARSAARCHGSAAGTTARTRVRLFDRAELFNLHPDCLAEVTSETPYFQERYEEARDGDLKTFRLDRPRWQLSLLRDAEKEYGINTGDAMQSWQRIGIAKFARNLATLDGHLSRARMTCLSPHDRSWMIIMPMRSGRWRTVSACSRRRMRTSRH